MTENGGTQVDLAIRIEDFVNNLRHMVYQHVPDDVAFQAMDDLLVSMGNDLVAFAVGVKELRDQRDELTAQNDALINEKEQILQSLDQWHRPSHPEVAKTIEGIEEEIWEEAGSESIAYAHDIIHEQLIENISDMLGDKYTLAKAVQLAAKLADIFVNYPDTDNSEKTADILKMLAEAVDDAE